MSPVISQSTAPDGEKLWAWIGWAFAGYWTLIAASALAHQRELNTLGGVLILAALAWALLERLWVKVDAAVLAAVAAMLVPLVQMVAGATQSGQAVFKYESLCAVIAISRLLRLPLASRIQRRWLLAAPVLLILLLSLVLPPGAGDETRHAGVFVNPNNLALIPFLLLFLIDDQRDPWPLRISVHAVIIAVLLFSGTSGATLAYLIGMLIHLRSRLAPALKMIALTAVLTAVGMVGLLAMSGDNLLPETRLTKQIALMGDQFQTVMEGGHISYYEEERTLGPGATSGIWRLEHWRHTLITYAGGTLAQQIFGFGVGASPLLLPNYPHNEYLRVLFEQGLLGVVLFVIIWRCILRTAPAPVRYAGLIVAIYCFSENNFDNFPFMSLFVLLLSAKELAGREFAARESPGVTP
jgi:hypothetical protein